jgi:hypothetical protein
MPSFNLEREDHMRNTELKHLSIDSVLAKPFSLTRTHHPLSPNLTGQTFNRLRVFSIHSLDRHGKVMWLCRCVCGGWSLVPTSALRTGATRSCGCCRRAAILTAITRHGASSTPEYRIYSHAKYRCQNPADHSYHNYGGRGIRFYFRTFEEFITYVGPRPSINHSLDRINNNGHYEPGNVRWATSKEQQVNTRRNRLIQYNDITRTVSQWAELLGVRYQSLATRLRAGWCGECIVTRPLRRVKGSGCPHKENK